MYGDEKCSLPAQENIYLGLVAQCRKIVEDIGLKTGFIRINQPETSKIPEPKGDSILERELCKLFDELRELHESYKI
jgi:hypothetical protein